MQPNYKKELKKLIPESHATDLEGFVAWLRTTYGDWFVTSYTTYIKNAWASHLKELAARGGDSGASHPGHPNGKRRQTEPNEPVRDPGDGTPPTL